MDILVSSNLERLLYHLEEDPEKITDFYQKFAETGRFLLPQRPVNKMSDIFCRLLQRRGNINYNTKFVSNNRVYLRPT